MLGLPARDLDVDGLRLRGLQRGVGQLHVGARGDPDAVLALRDLQRLLVGLDGARVQLLLGIRHAQQDVVADHLRLDRQPRCREVRLAGLRAVTGAFHGAPGTTPEIGLPAGLQRPRMRIAERRRPGGRLAAGTTH